MAGIAGGRRPPELAPPPVGKDQQAAENCIPLSPQWLYAKPADSKFSLQDAHPQVSTSNGNMPDVALKDSWCLEKQEEKKERKKMPGADSCHRWHEEERDTSLLRRRPRRKEVDRETEYRKSERRSGNLLIRDGADSWSLPLAERRCEKFSCNSGNECRHDSKWSSRQDLEDKDKDSPSERKVDADEGDSHAEKQVLPGGHRLLPESDSSYKWRPRHRQEVHCSGSAAFHATPGLGLERESVGASYTGFAAGRGRAISILGMPMCKPFSSGPIGAAPAGKSAHEDESSIASVDVFRYPRGKLLDIYRRERRHLSSEAPAKALKDVSSITLSSSTTPLAFVTPVADEEASIDNIWKGKVISSEAHYSSGECMTKGQDHDTDIGGRVVAEEKHVIPSDSPVNAKTSDCSPGEGKDKSAALSSGVDHDVTASLVSENDAFYDIEVVAGNFDDFVENIGAENFLDNNEHVEQPVLQKSLQLKDKLDSICPQNTGFDQNIVDKTKFLEKVTFEKLTLFYQDPQGGIQGPFLGSDIIAWFEEGYFGIDLPVCPSDAPEGTPFKPLDEIMPHLGLKLDNGSPSQSSVALAAAGNLETDSLASDINNPVQTALTPTSYLSDHPVKPSSSEHGISMDSHAGMFSLSDSANAATIRGSQGHSFQDYAGQDTEEELYKGRPNYSMDKLPENLTGDSFGLLCSSKDQFMLSEMGETHLSHQKGPNIHGLDSCRSFWAEPEGNHLKNSPSSSIVNAADQGFFNPAASMDISLLRQRQEQLGEPHGVPQEWSANYRSNGVSKGTPDAIGSRKLTHNAAESSHLYLEENLFSERQYEQQVHRQQLLAQRDMDFSGLLADPAEASYLNVEEQLLSQHLRGQFQEQQLLAEKQALAHRKTDFPGVFVEQTRDSLRHQQVMNQQGPDPERVINLLLLEIQKPQYRHLLYEANQEYQLQQHQMWLLRWRRRQQQQQHQLLQEQILYQQFQDASLPPDPNFMALHIDPQHTDLDGIQLRQHLLNKSHQQSHYFQQQHDAAVEQLIQAKLSHSPHPNQDMLEIQSRYEHGRLVLTDQELLDIRREKLQAQHLMTRRQPRFEEDRHVGGGVWSVDKYCQFIGETDSQEQVQSMGGSQLDFAQPFSSSSSFQLPSHIDLNIALHDQLNRGCEADSLHTSLSTPSGISSQNIERANALTQLHRLDHQGQQLYDGSVQDVVERQWSSSSEQLSNGFLESRFRNMQFEAEQHRRDLSVIPSFENPNVFSSLIGTGGDKERDLRDMTNQKPALQKFHQTSGLVDGDSAFSYGHVDSWLNSRPVAGRDRIFYSYDGEDDVAFGEEILWNSRNPTGMSNGSGNTSARHSVDRKAMTSQVASSEPASTQLVTERKQEPGSDLPSGVSEAPTSNTINLRYPGTSLNGDTAASETSYAEMLSSARTPTSLAVSGGKSSKKKGKKGKLIDPSLLGFKVHSSCQNVGEIDHVGG